jgi:adenine-specific DNA-methyltransferase
LGSYTVLKDVYDGKDLKKWATPRPFKKMIVFESKSTSKIFGKLSEDLAFEKMKVAYPEIIQSSCAFQRESKKALRPRASFGGN